MLTRNAAGVAASSQRASAMRRMRRRALADTLYADLHAAMLAAADPERAIGVRNYFKEPVETLGIPVPQARALTRPIAARLKRDLDLTVRIAKAAKIEPE